MINNTGNEVLMFAVKQIILQLAVDNGVSYDDFYAELQEDIENGLKTFNTNSDATYPGTLDQYTFWKGLPVYSQHDIPTPEEYILYGAGYLTSRALVLPNR